MLQFSQRYFGSFDNRDVMEYSISHESGISLSVINYGGIIRSLIAPDRKGLMENVVLGFDTLEEYIYYGSSYIGCIIGRYANRISHGQFLIDNIKFNLTRNEDGNTLHGGARGFDKVFWEIEEMPAQQGIILRYTSADGEEGFPGNLQISVCYSLPSPSILRVDYQAKTDRDCPVSLTQHSYFNLSAGRQATIIDHILRIHASSICELDGHHLPTGNVQSLDNLAFDFRQAKRIGLDYNKAGDFDHHYILDKSPYAMEWAASLTDPFSGRSLDLFTTEPGVQFYAGKYLGTTAGIFPEHAGLCLEPQQFPDAPNKPQFPQAILRKGEMYRQRSEYVFGVVPAK